MLQLLARHEFERAVASNRVLAVGFSRVPDAAEILGPILAWKTECSNCVPQAPRPFHRGDQ